MLTTDRTITDYAQRRRILGRRADIRLARALRQSVPFHRKLRQHILSGMRARPRLIRKWQNGSFVETSVSWPEAV